MCSPLESPHQVHKIYHFQYKKKKISPYYPKSAAMGFFSKGLKNEFETAVVNEPSVFVSLKFYCILFKKILRVGKRN